MNAIPKVTGALYSTLVDSLANVISGLGTTKDKSYHTTYAFNQLSRSDLDFAYRGDWIARKVIDVPVDDAVREWRAWQAEDSAIELIENAEQALKIQSRIHKVWRMGRLYGGAALILGVDGQGSPDTELDPSKVKKDQLKFVHAVSCHQLTFQQIQDDLTKPYFGEPAMYQRQMANGVPLNIHPSRVIRFTGRDRLDEDVAPMEWGDSLLQSVDDAIRAAGTVAMSGAAMINEAKVDIIKIADLSHNLTTQEYATRLTSRLTLANQMKSIINTLVIDKEEEMERIQTQLAGFAEVMQMYLMIASGAADIPATRMLAQSPTGMNSTGESDIRNYYDRLRSEQETVLTPKIAVLDQVLMRSATGSENADFFYEWNPLWQMTEVEKADVATKKATVMTADVTAGLIPLEALRVGRQNQLVEDGTYPGLEQALEEFDDEETPAEEARLLGQEQQQKLLEAPVPKPGEKKPFGDHTPGGHSHNQKTHGRESSESQHPTHPLPDKYNSEDPNTGYAYDIPDEDGGETMMMVVTRRKDGTYYGAGTEFDTETKTAAEMRAKLQKWKAKYAGIDNFTDGALRDAEKISAFVKVGPNQYKKKGGKGKIYNYEQVKLWYARKAEGTAWDSVQPRTLYVRRDVKNAGAIVKWAKEQGFETTLPASKMHVTIAFSRAELDWTKVTEFWSGDNGQLTIPPGGMRMVERLGENGEAVVLMFASSQLGYRHEQIKEAGASWDWPEYQPHITISWKVPPEFNIGEVEPYRGEIVLGPEIFEELDDDWRSKVTEDARVVPFDHTPGGHDHDQSTHGNRGDDWHSGIVTKYPRDREMRVAIRNLPRDAASEEIELKISDLIPNQDTVNERTVERYMDEIDNNIAATVYKFDGKWIVDDDHHRIVAASRLGYNTVIAEVTDLDRYRRDAYNPNQPRHPKGDPNGGKFAPITPGSAVSAEDAERDQGVKDTKNYLEQVDKFQRMNMQIEGETPNGFQLKHGRGFLPDANTYKGKRGTPKQCYMNASKAALYDPNLTYVEGYIQVHGVPIAHAWNTDSKGRLIDPTLRNDPAMRVSGYYGVPVKTSYLRETALRTKVWGVFSYTNPKYLSDDPSRIVKRDLTALDDADYVADFDPNQPRYAKGDPRGGQWAPMGSSSSPASDLFELNHDPDKTIDDVYREIPDDVKEKMRESLIEASKMTPTNKLYMQTDGTYTPERQELHNKILADMFTQEAIQSSLPKDGKPPNLIMLGGRPAAGKTSTMGHSFGADHFYLSADTIQEKLPGYKGHLAQVFNGEGQDIALRAEAIARQHRMNILYDATLKTASSAQERVRDYKAAGYTVEGHFVHTAPEVSAVRSAMRFERTGRLVPPEVSFNSRTNEKTFDSLIPEFRRWSVHDNNGPTPRMVARGGVR